MYSLANEDKCLSATAEIPLAGMYLNNEFLLCDLPIKYARLLYLYLLFLHNIRLVAFGRCFRVETGKIPFLSCVTLS